MSSHKKYPVGGILSAVHHVIYTFEEYIWFFPNIGHAAFARMQPFVL